MSYASPVRGATEVVGRILGPLDVVGPVGHVRPSAGKHRILLGGLLLRANQAVTAADIVDWLWADEPPATALPTLRTYVMRLRRELAAVPAERLRIHSEPDGYALTLPPDGSDLLLFRQFVDRSRQVGDDPAAAVEHLRRAERLWRGPALADVPSDRLQREEVPRLTEERVSALERRLDLELLVGRHAEVVGELRELTAKHPLRERFWGQLMLALYRGGRQAEALDCYRTVRALLAEEFGVEPGEELRRRHQQVLGGGADSAAPGPARAVVAGGERPVRPTRSATPCLLPPDLGDFVGRADEVAAATSRLVPRRPAHALPVLVVCGPAGVGKSALAVQVAHRLRRRFPDGQWYVHLGGVGAPRDPDDVLDQLLALAGTAAGGDTEARAAALRGELTGRRVLLVLDDAATAGQVRPLLPGTARCAVVVTSRRSLTDLSAAGRLRLGPLTAADAHRLLAARLGEARCAAEPAALAAIAEACDRLPAALRIAGVRLATLPDLGLGAFAARLADSGRRLDELEIGTLRLRSVLADGCAELDPPVRRVLAQLGLLARGDFPSWLLGVVDPTVAPDRAAEQLVDASLIVPAGRDEAGEPLYRLPRLLGLYAAELAAREPAARREAARAG